MSQLAPNRRNASAARSSSSQRDRSRRAVSAMSVLRARSGMRPGLGSDARLPLNETELGRTYRAVACSLVERVVSIEMRISIDALHARTRSTAEVSFARQVAMYLANTIFKITQSDVGGRFGRDRTTVKHACARIEDRRDDAAFEARLTAMEAVLEEARFGMQLFALQGDTVTERVLIEIGAKPNPVEDRP